MTMIREKTHRGRLWPIWMLVLAMPLLGMFVLASIGCDRGSEIDPPDPEKEGVANTGDPVQELRGEEVGEPVEVTKLELGKSINAEKTISRPATSFYTDETVYVSVHVQGSADNIRLTSRWYRGDEVIETVEHRTSTNEGMVTEMHIGETPDPLPVGDYIVEVRLDETVVGALPFKVVPGDE